MPSSNSSTGFDGGNLVNAWDFVLMMEGTVLAHLENAFGVYNTNGSPVAVRWRR